MNEDTLEEWDRKRVRNNRRLLVIASIIAIILTIYLFLNGIVK